MPSVPFITLDVFTTTAYEGNPLSIIRIPSSLRHLLTPARKQLIATEFNLSESVFIHEALDPGVREWEIDIYTTQDELPFAGHPTIGAACYVLGNSREGEEAIRDGVFITRAGRVPISRVEDRSGLRVQIEVPHHVHVHAHTMGDLQGHVPGLSLPRELFEAEMRAPMVSIVKGMTFLLVRLETLEMLGRVQTTSAELSFHGVLDAGWAEGFVARYYYVVEKTSSLNGNGIGKGKDVDVVRIRTRMLEEKMEDPATGSAASALGCYLALQDGATKRFEMVQGVEMGRRSVIGVEVVVDEMGKKVESVRLSGSAVQVMEGNLSI